MTEHKRGACTACTRDAPMTASAANANGRARRRGRNEVRLVGSIGINDTGESTNSLGITGAADLAQGPHCSAAHRR